MIALLAALIAVPSSTTTPMLEDGPPVARVEARELAKDGRILTRAGFAWWSRDDLRVNPGVAVEATWYLSEQIGLDLLSATVFFSHLSAAAESLRRETGLLPDSERPLVRVMAGGRLSLAYGKLLIEGAGVVIHLDLAARAHAGLIITASAPNPGADIGLAVQVRVGERVTVWADGAWMLSYEDRIATALASGLALATGIGLAW